MAISTRIALVVVVVISLSQCVAAQNPISLSIKTKSGTTELKAGDKLAIQVIAQIKEGWHLYSTTQQPGGPIATRISLPPNQPFKLAGAIRSPAPLTELDPNFGIDTQFYEDSAVFTLPVVATSSAATTAQRRLLVNVFFQTCNDRFCLPPKTVKLSLPVQFADSAPAEPQETLIPVTAEQTAVTSALLPESPKEQIVGPAPTATPVENASAAHFAPNSRRSFLSFIWLAMSLGALSLLTPCVFPMIPITVSYFASHSSRDRIAASRNALIYCVGIILTFTALGLILAAVFGAAGINRFAANPWINLIIAAVFLGFAVSLLGGFNLGVPSRLLTKLDAFSRGNESTKILGLLLMGLTFSLTSFTCTAPFVGSLLVLAAQGQWLFPIAGMLAFSSVFAIPFFILSLAPQLISHLPKSGGWLNSVKVVMGLLEIAAATKFLSNADLVWQWNIFSRSVVLASWVAVTLLITLYLLGKLQLPHDSPVQSVGTLRLLIVIVALSLTVYLLTGLFGGRLGELESFLPPALNASSSVSSPVENSDLTWIVNDYQNALSQARTTNKPLFVDFTGYTCTNCRWMEVNMFTKGPIREELIRFIRVRLYTDGEGQPYEQFQQMQQEKFGTVALPLYAVIGGDGAAIATFAGLTRDQSEFVTFLRSAAEKSRPTNR